MPGAGRLTFRNMLKTPMHPKPDKFHWAIFLVALLFCLSTPCWADTLYLGAKSHHFDPVGDGITRESHALIIYENDDGWMGGYWRNSFNKDTYAIGYHHKFWRNEEFKASFGVKGGFATGYNLPVFGTLNAQVWMFDVNYVPHEVITVGFKYDF